VLHYPQAWLSRTVSERIGTRLAGSQGRIGVSMSVGWSTSCSPPFSQQARLAHAAPTASPTPHKSAGVQAAPRSPAHHGTLEMPR
jgi:hypothetical protein